MPQVAKFLLLNGPDDSAKHFIPVLEKLDLLFQMAMHGALYSSRADHDA